MTLQFLCFVATCEAVGPATASMRLIPPFFETRSRRAATQVFRFGAEELSSSLSGLIGPENSELRA
jgi:hypothetical protein